MSYSGLDIYLILFKQIPGIFVHYFQVIRTIFYVCHYTSWLTSFLKLDKYRIISWSGWDISVKIFVEILDIFVQYLHIIRKFLFVC